ncbi:MAG: hypothetical protein GEU87_01335 [Alphaproteobacteria bacterium]|nr:hypothetical protein [Alphaproteobacteria bacterium]
MVDVIADATPTFKVILPSPPANVAFPGDVVEILADGVLEESQVLTAIDTTRRFALVTVTPAVADATYEFTARIRRNGSTSASSPVLMVRIDTVAPSAPTLALHPSDDKGGGVTVQPRPRFVVGLPVDAEAGGTAALWIDDLEDPGVTLDAGDLTAGQIEIRAAAVLDVGLHVAYARVTDQAGNQGPASNVVGFELTAFAAGVESAGTPAGGLTVEKRLAGGVQSASTPAADLHAATQIQLEGAIASTGAPAGSATVEKPFAAAVASASTLAGGLTVEKPLAGGIETDSEPAGDLTVVAPVTLEAGIAAHGALAGAATVEKPLAAAAASSSAPAGGLTVEKRLAAGVESDAAPAGDLHVAAPAALEGAVTSTGTPAGAATVEKPVAAAAASTSAPAGGLTVEKRLAAAIASAAQPNGDLHVASPVLLEAAVASTGTPAGAATVEKPLAAAAASSSAPAGGLTVEKRLAGAIASAGTPAGAVSVERALSAGVVSVGSPGGQTVGAVEFATPTPSALRWGNPGPSGNADSDKVTIVAWYRLLTLPGAAGVPQSIFNIEAGTTGDSLQLIVDTDNRLKLRSWNNAAGISLLSTAAETLDGAWHCIMGSFDGDLANGGAGGFTHLWRDGVNVLAGGAAPALVLPDLTRPIKIGGRTSFGNTWAYAGQLALVWYNHGIALDFGDGAERAKFFAGGTFVPVGANGELPTGNAPRICLQGGATAFKDNVGLGNDPIDEIGVGLIDAAGPANVDGGLTVEPALVAAVASASTPAGGLTVEKPLAAAVASAGAPAGILTAFSEAIRAVEYDGSADFLVYAPATHGAANGPALTIGAALKSNLDGVEQVLFDCGGAVPVRLVKNADNTFSFTGGTAGAVFSAVTAAVAASVGDCIVLADANGTTAHLYIIHAAGLVTGVNTPGSAAALSLANDWHFGETTAGGSRLDAALAMWWVRAAALDFSVANNREQFWDTTAHKLRDPGPTGANPLDGAGVPNVFNVEPAASHGERADSAGLFDDGTSPGTYAPDFVPSSSPFELTDSGEDGANLTIYTFAAKAIGAADAGRVVAVSIHGRTGTSGKTILSVTIGGVAATQRVFAEGGPGTVRNQCAVWTANVPTGTTADVVVTWSAEVVTCAITVYRLEISSETPTDTATDILDTAEVLTLNLDVAAGGIIIAAATNGVAASSATWAGITERHDALIENLNYSSAADSFVSGGTENLTVTMAPNASDGAACAVSFPTA